MTAQASTESTDFIACILHRDITRHLVWSIEKYIHYDSDVQDRPTIHRARSLRESATGARQGSRLLECLLACIGLYAKGGLAGLAHDRSCQGQSTDPLLPKDSLNLGQGFMKCVAR